MVEDWNARVHRLDAPLLDLPSRGRLARLVPDPPQVLLQSNCLPGRTAENTGKTGSGLWFQVGFVPLCDIAPQETRRKRGREAVNKYPSDSTPSPDPGSSSRRRSRCCSFRAASRFSR